MAKLKKLPRAGHWEVDLVSMPEVQIHDVVLVGMLMVVERPDGVVRYAAPVELGADIGAMLVVAATEPIPPQARARPRTIRCRQAMKASLSSAAASLGAKLLITDDLPAIDEFADSLRGHMSAGPAWLPEEDGPWRTAMMEFVEAAPWRALSDAVLFQFTGGSNTLQNTVGIVLGLAGEQHGFVLYPCKQDYENFYRAARSGPGVLAADWSCWCAHLDFAEDLAPAHVAQARRSGLVRQGFVLQVFAMTPDGARPLQPHEERACVVALQGMLGAWKAKGERLEYEPSSIAVRTIDGPVTVQTHPGGAAVSQDKPVILDVEHLAVLTKTQYDGVEQPTLVLKMAKRDAVRLSTLVEGVDGLTLEPTGHGELDVVAWVGRHRLGVITRVGHNDRLWEPWKEAGEGLLVITAGGAKRRRLRPQDTVSIHSVGFEQPPEEADREGMFDSSWLDGASWEGPAETWPKASTVLLAFAEPLGLLQLPPEAVEQVAMIACTVWTAVVMADNAGDSTFLDDVRRSAASDPSTSAVFEMLIGRKRQEFPQDTRIMMLNSVARGQERVDVNVSWRLA